MDFSKIENSMIRIAHLFTKHKGRDILSQEDRKEEKMSQQDKRRREPRETYELKTEYESADNAELPRRTYEFESI